MKKRTYILIILSLFIFSVATYGITIYHKNIASTNTSGLEPALIGDYHELCIKNENLHTNHVLANKNIINKYLLNDWIYYIPETFDGIFKVKLDGTQNTKLCSIDMMQPFNPKEMKIESEYIPKHDWDINTESAAISYKIIPLFENTRQDTLYPERNYLLNISTSSLIYASDRSYPQIPVHSVFSGPFDIVYALPFYSGPEFADIQKLSYALDTPITYDNQLQQVLLKTSKFTLAFSKDFHTLTINDTTYNYTHSPHMFHDLLFIPVKETCEFIADYILTNNAYFDFFSDLSHTPQEDASRKGPRFPFIFFYKTKEDVQVRSILSQTSFDKFKKNFDITYTLEIWGDRIFYYFNSPNFSGCYIEEYEDNDLKKLCTQHLDSITMTSPNFFSDRLIHVGSTKEEVIKHYGSPSNDASDDTWCTFKICEGTGVTFYFKDNIVTKIEYGW